MKVLVLGDIHSNWVALSAVAAAEPGPFDACFVTGDLVDYGSDPIHCLKWVREHATAAVRGNHDHAVAQRVPVRPGSGFKAIAAAARPLHWQVLGREEMKFLARLPVTCRMAVGDQTYLLVHATPRDPMDEYLGNDARAWAARLELVEAEFVLVGHTHIPYVLKLDKTTVVNPGSVGQPRDGDPRACYAVIEDGRVELRRVEYDVEAAIEDLRRFGVRGNAFDLAARVLRTGGTG